MYREKLELFFIFIYIKSTALSESKYKILLIYTLLGTPIFVTCAIIFSLLLTKNVDLIGLIVDNEL